MLPVNRFRFVFKFQCRWFSHQNVTEFIIIYHCINFVGPFKNITGVVHVFGGYANLMSNQMINPLIWYSNLTRHTTTKKSASFIKNSLFSLSIFYKRKPSNQEPDKSTCDVDDRINQLNVINFTWLLTYQFVFYLCLKTTRLINN